ncbi:unnamed protein product [Protopolystoma xenopodis]|uniref:Endonuclease/exonuclease/phosphatase domain-containing protein n=1 Tax=Protopolystoma xenopodis TaxID=117903 RepID=A0A448WQI9_9PLAT|nr:unnamed protein product [Protopolystoma xenopodis]
MSTTSNVGMIISNDVVDYDAGETSGNVPRPRSDFRNDYAYNELRTRLSFPNSESAFTCWNTRTGARQTNYGTRIDYILIDPYLAQLISSCLPVGSSPIFDGHYAVENEDHGSIPHPPRKASSSWWTTIMPSVHGSDHCPVWVRIPIALDFNHSLPNSSQTGLPDFDGKLAVVSQPLPILCTSYLPQCQGAHRQTSLSCFVSTKGSTFLNSPSQQHMPTMNQSLDANQCSTLFNRPKSTSQIGLETALKDVNKSENLKPCNKFQSRRHVSTTKQTKLPLIRCKVFPTSVRSYNPSTFGFTNCSTSITRIFHNYFPQLRFIKRALECLLCLENR